MGLILGSSVGVGNSHQEQYLWILSFPGTVDIFVSSELLIPGPPHMFTMVPYWHSVVSPSCT